MHERKQLPPMLHVGHNHSYSLLPGQYLDHIAQFLDSPVSPLSGVILPGVFCGGLYFFHGFLLWQYLNVASVWYAFHGFYLYLHSQLWDVCESFCLSFSLSISVSVFLVILISLKNKPTLGMVGVLPTVQITFVASLIKHYNYELSAYNKNG